MRTPNSEPQTPNSELRTPNSDRGIALFLALMTLTVLTLLGLAMMTNSHTEGEIHENYEAEVTARWLAETGVRQALMELRGQDFTQVLRGANGRPDSSDAEARALDFRNPIPRRGSGPPPERVDITDGPAVAAAVRTDDGVPRQRGPGGVGYYRRAGPDGRFGTADDVAFFDTEQPPAPGEAPAGRGLIKITNNPEDPGGPFADTDGALVIRTMGLARRRRAGGRLAVATIETRVRRDRTFQTDAPVTVLGPALQPAGARLLDPGRTRVDGYEYLGWAMLNPTGSYADPLAEPMTQQALAAPGSDAVVGAGLVRSIRNLTGLATAGQGWAGVDNPDLQRGLDPAWLRRWVYETLPALADQTFRGGDPGLSAWQGTVAEPRLVWVGGDLTVAGNPAGAGLLAVTGRLRITGNPVFRGLILVIGEQAAADITGQPLIEGGLWIARLRAAGAGAVWDVVPCSLAGTLQNRRAPNYQTLATSLLPLVRTQWREIHPEMDP